MMTDVVPGSGVAAVWDEVVCPPGGFVMPATIRESLLKLDAEFCSDLAFWRINNYL